MFAAGSASRPGLGSRAGGGRVGGVGGSLAGRKGRLGVGTRGAARQAAFGPPLGARPASSELRFPGKKPLFWPERGKWATSCPGLRGALLRGPTRPLPFRAGVPRFGAEVSCFAREPNGPGAGKEWETKYWSGGAV